MIINKKSWHYKFLKSNLEKEKIPTNLCDYVKTLSVGISMFSLTGIFMFSILFMLANVFYDSWKRSHAVTLAILGFGVVLIAAIRVVPFLYKEVKKLDTYNLVSSFIKAKKEKYCPIIEFKE